MRVKVMVGGVRAIPRHPAHCLVKPSFAAGAATIAAPRAAVAAREQRAASAGSPSTA